MKMFLLLVVVKNNYPYCHKFFYGNVSSIYKLSTVLESAIFNFSLHSTARLFVCLFFKKTDN